MKVLLFEPAVEGHRLHFVGLIAEALARHRIRFAWALPSSAMNSPDGVTHLGPTRWSHRLILLPDTPPATDPFSFWKRQLSAALSDSRANYLLLPSADGLAQSMGIRGMPVGIRNREVDVDALMMRGSFAYERRFDLQGLRARMSKWLLGRTPWHRLYFLDPLVIRALKRSLNGSLRRACRLMPEPIEEMNAISREAARNLLRVPSEARVIGVCGRLDTRKGIDLLLHAFARARFGPEARLLMVGRASQEIQNLLEGEYAGLVRDRRILVHEDFADGRKFEAVFHASDCIATPYPRHVGSSGILLRAARCGKPVLASDWGWVGWVTRRFRLGWTVNVEDVEAFSRMISRCMTQDCEFSPSEESVRLMQFHSVGNFQSHWLQPILARSGRELPEPPLDWDETVLQGREESFGC